LDGTRFIETSRQEGENIVFVTLNYRLGALGFLAGSDLGLNGNFGIQDQQKALQWVQKNISRFGGNPNRVMLFGESAGAQSTALHLTISSSQSLFQSAILESSYAIAYMPVSEAQARATLFAKALGCNGDDLACLRGQSVSAILSKQLRTIDIVECIACSGLEAVIPWNPVIDGVLITQSPINAAISKPIMIGTNRNESIPFLGIIPPIPEVEKTAYDAMMVFLFGDLKAAEISVLYDKLLLDSPLEKLEQAVTDYLWTCFNRKFADKPVQSVHRYFYTHPGSFPFWVDEDGGTQSLVSFACQQRNNVCHAAELPFVFGNAVNNQSIIAKPPGFTPDEQDMSVALRRYWIQFARTSDPNVQGQVNWPLNTAQRVLKISAPSSAMTSVTDESIATPANCSLLWDRIGYEVKSAFSCKEW